MKKMSSTVLSVVLAGSMLAGCATEVQKETPSAEQKAQEPITIKYYTWEVRDNTKKQIDAYMKAHPNIKVEPIVLVNGDTAASLQKLDVLVTAGEPVDLVRLPNADWVLQRAANGVFAPMNEYFTKDNVKPEDEYYVNVKWKGNYYTMMDTISFWLVAFNEKHLAEANLKLPEMGWTWDDFREYAKKLTTPKRSGAFFYTWSEYANPVLYTERKNPHIKADLSPQFDDSSFKNYFGLRRAMEKEDKSTKPYSTVIGANLHFTTEFFNEEASMMMYNTRVIDYANDTKKFPHDFKTAFAPLPRSSKDAEIGNTNMGGEFYSIGAKSKYKKETYELIRWLTTEGTKLGVSGLPGWKKADGKAAVDTIIGSNKELFNIDSLMTTLYDKRVKTSVDTDLAVPYQAELRKVLEEGFKKYMLDNTSVEEAQKYMMDEANKVSQRNK